MKKIFCALLLIAVFGSISSCKKEEVDLTDSLLPQRVVAESDEWLATRTYTYDDSKITNISEVIQDLSTGETWSNNTEYSFTNNRIDQRTDSYTYTDGTVSTTSWQYNYYENGKFHSRERIGEDPDFYFDHSDNGLIVSEYTTWNNDKISEFTYNEDRNLIQSIRNYGEDYEFSYEYVYDDSHCPFRNVAPSDPGNNYFFTCVNNEARRTLYSSDGSVQETINTLQYNEHGFLTKKISGNWTTTYHYE
jgi:hypothetical protein